jgi:hypothetical protein
MKLEWSLWDEPPSNQVTDSISIKISKLSIDDRPFFFPNHQFPIPLGDFKPMIRIRNEPFHQGIGHFDVSRPSYALQLSHESGRISRMLENMRGNDKVECFVPERKMLDKSKNGRAVSLEWNPMSLARDLEGIKQNVRPRIGIATRSNF